MFFEDTKKATFVSRPNRFTVVCHLKGKEVKAFLPNPGRLWELLLPGATLHLEEVQDPGHSLPYTAVAVEKEGHPVILHTHRVNEIARFLIEKGRIPGLEGAEILKKEVTKGPSRFDFLLRKGAGQILLEVKSCTLVSKRVAMFPDAITARGRRHIEELARLSRDKTQGAVLFLIHWPSAEAFLPEHHTDLDFARALWAARKRIMVIPVALRWREDLSLAPEVRVVDVPWRIIEREAQDRGSYLLLLRLPQEATINIGRLGRIHFRRGYYIYVGSAKMNLRKRIERHRRLTKRPFWHVDLLRAVAQFHRVLPIRSQDDLECEMARAIAMITPWSVPGFGSSDCSCLSHLFWAEEDPMTSSQFHWFLQYYRMDRLLDLP